MQKKQKMLAQVIAIQERTLNKLQKVFETEKSSIMNSSRKSKKETGKKRQMSDYQVQKAKPSFHTQPSITKCLSSKKDSLTTRQNISAIADNAYYKNMPKQMEVFRSQQIDQSLSKEKEYKDKIEYLEWQLSEKENQIQELKLQVEDKEKIEAEFSKQRKKWQELYGDLTEEISQLKNDVTHFKHPNTRRQSGKKHFVCEESDEQMMSEFENKRYFAYREQLGRY